MRIQFLYPPSAVSPGNLGNARPALPLGLAYVVAALRDAGHECTVIDAIAEAPQQLTPEGRAQRLGLTDEQILARLDPTSRALAISSMFSFNWPSLRELIKKIRAHRPDMKIVCGGEHFSGLAETSMRTAPIDYVVFGEGEETAVELFAALERGGESSASSIAGVCWRDGEQVVRNAPRKRTKNVDQIAWPAWDLFRLDAYNEHDLIGGLSLGTTVPILATRGCPYQCTYCSSPQMWTTRWYPRDPIDVVDEIQHYVERYGARNFPFQDLTMIIKQDWIISFCQELINRRLDINWQLPTGTRCEVIDEKVAPLLHQSGCRWLCYAPESGSARTRELIKKRMNEEDLFEAIHASVAAKLHLETFFVIGFPHDTIEDMEETRRMVRKLARAGVEDIAVNFFFPIPSTELFDQLVAKGRMSATDDELMNPLFVHEKQLVDSRHYCEHVSAKDLTRWKYKILLAFYTTSYATHPLRVARVMFNALRGKQTSALEKFLGERGRKLLRGRRTRERAPSAA